MKIVNKSLMKSLHAAGRCESCRRTRPTVPHHLRRRGHGGGFRMDVSIGLIALCSDCHAAEHAGLLVDGLGVSCLLKDVAKRERVEPEDIEAVLCLLDRLDHKRGGLFTHRGRSLEDELSDLRGPARELALRVLVEVGVEIRRVA